MARFGGYRFGSGVSWWIGKIGSDGSAAPDLWCSFDRAREVPKERLSLVYG
jgi:hypothetical protein